MPLLEVHKLEKSLILLSIFMIMLFTFVQQTQGIPISRTLSQAGFKDDQMTMPTLKHELERTEASVIGRSDIETEDYPGSEANRSHEPGGGSRSPDHPGH
eukprot:TRINITY_DN3124_c0_g1_i1.p2 TRINITY_DN3124_c0_g1~~TRINITY_DN3124_c0_g1_i1.p2  ORF type:complete len:100 (+),score=9.26 TRINITY_DN3124_c0_g1_i1:312-611(+)